MAQLEGVGMEGVWQSWKARWNKWTHFFFHLNLLICFSKSVSSDLGRVKIKEWSSNASECRFAFQGTCLNMLVSVWVLNQSAQTDLLAIGPGNLPCEETLQVLLIIKNLQTTGVKIHFLVLIFNIFVSKWRLFNSDEILVQSKRMGADIKQYITSLLCFHD